jgi:hypothetical protein
MCRKLVGWIRPTSADQSKRNASTVFIIGQAEIAASNPKRSSSIKNAHRVSVLNSCADSRIEIGERFPTRLTTTIRGFIGEFVLEFRTRIATPVTLQTVAIRLRFGEQVVCQHTWDATGNLLLRLCGEAETAFHGRRPS